MTRNEPDPPEAHEPSYYEIALTNRQVVAAFVVLLACVVVSFFGGLWVGRESATREAEAVLRDTPPPPQVAETAATTDKLDFFSVPQGSPQVDPKDKVAKGTLREDLDRRDQTLGNPSVDANGGVETDDTADPIEEPAPAPPPPTKAPPVKIPPPEPRPEKKPARPEKAERSDPEPPKGSFVVQVFSTSERDQALKVRNRLTGGGEKAYLSPVKASSGTMYRVRVGPFTTRAAAQKVADKVRKGYRLDTWVTQ